MKVTTKSRLSAADLLEAMRGIGPPTGTLLQCPVCSYYTLRDQDFQQHIIQSHSQERPFKCVVSGCGYAGTLSYSLANHVKGMHGKPTKEKTFECKPTKEKTFECKPTKEKTFECKSTKGRKFECKSTKGRKFECPECKQRFLKHSYMMRHICSEHCDLSPQYSTIKQHHGPETDKLHDQMDNSTEEHNDSTNEDITNSNDMDSKEHTTIEGVVTIVRKPKRRKTPSKSQLKDCSSSTDPTSHVIIPTQQKLLQCEHCEVKCKSKYRLNTHIRNVHIYPTTKLFKCIVCSFEAKNGLLLGIHVKTHIKNDRFHCEVPGCEYIGKSYSSFRNHTTMNHAKIPSNTSMIGNASMTSSPAVSNVHVFNSTTVLGNNTFVADTDTGSSVDTAVSDIAGDTAVSDIFAVDTADTDSEVDTDVSDRVLDKAVLKKEGDAATIAKNIASATADTSQPLFAPYLCPKCNFTCFKTVSLNRHMKMEHPKEDTDPCLSKTIDGVYKCSKCTHKTPNKYCMKIHFGSHSTETPFVCQFPNCEYSGKLLHNLNKHIRKSHKNGSVLTIPKKLVKPIQEKVDGKKEKPFMCSYCGILFPTSSHLNCHIKIHTGEKPTMCDQCSYRCRKKSDLARHMRSHQPNKTYMCDLCAFRSSYLSSYLQHVKKHSSERPMKCRFCDYACIFRSALRSHERRRHNAVHNHIAD